MSSKRAGTSSSSKRPATSSSSGSSRGSRAGSDDSNEGKRPQSDCDTCKGKGVWRYRGPTDVQVKCERCMGHGKQFNKPCPQCKGKGTVTKRMIAWICERCGCDGYY
jgi:DnaJ-class molecular chaperone